MRVYKDYIYEPGAYAIPSTPFQPPMQQLVKRFYRMMTTTTIYSQLNSSLHYCPHCQAPLDWDVFHGQLNLFCPTCDYVDTL